MAQVINTNISSLNAQRNLNTSQSALATSLQRLSSGLRINSAKDDAAGLAISDRMTSQIRGLNQAARNANDGVSLAQTAEGGLSEVASNLQRIRELAIQSANATNTSSDRASLNAEVTQLLAEIQRVATTSQFNGQNILDGTFTAAQFQVGANANQTITASTGNAQTSAIGAYQYNNTSSAVSGTALASGDLTINGVNVGATADGSADTIVNAINGVTNQTSVTATATSSIVAANAPTGKVNLASGDLVINGVNIGAVTGNYNLATQGASIATAINAKTNATGVTASANTTTGALTLSSSTGKTIAITTNNTLAGAARVENATGLELSASTALAANQLTLTGTKGASVATFAFANYTAGDEVTIGDKTYVLDDGETTGADAGGGKFFIGGGFTDDATLNAEILDAINGTSNSASAVTGVVGTTTGGTNITVTADALGITAAPVTTITDGGGGAATAITNTLGTGIAENSTVILDGTTYTFITGATSGNNISLTQAGASNTALNLVATAFANAIDTNFAANTTDVDAGTVVGGVFSVTSVLRGTPGNSVVDASGTAITAGVAESITAATDGAYTASTTYGIISLSSNSAYSISGNDPAKAGLSTASSTLNTLGAVDISSVAGANSAISVVDGALSQVATIRGAMGALQNRFQSVVSSLTASSENLSAARSRIQDADFAAETAQLTRNQILQQAGVAMLAQANALPNNVLTLLRG
jgi:flagellin